MPFQQLVNPQQIEASVAGPGDVGSLYLCTGLARGTFSITVPAAAGQWMNVSDTWQFDVGPRIDSTQFRRAIATASFAGLQLMEQGALNVNWLVESVFADYDDDASQVRVSVRNTISAYNMMPAGAQPDVPGVSEVAYNVSILAAAPPA